MLSINSDFFESLHKEQWKEVRLGDLCLKIDYGYTTSSTLQNTGIKFLRITDIVPPRIDWDSVPYCDIDLKNLEKYLLEIGDIVIARTGATAGYNKYINEKFKCVFASYLVRFRINPNIANPHFVSYYLQNRRWTEFVNGTLGGSAQPNINAKQMSDFHLKLPPLPIQQQIAEFLSSFDDKIDLLTRQNKTLESLALTLFRHTFIDNSNRDEWEEKALSEVCEIKNGFAFKHEEYQNEGIPIIRTTNFENGFIETNNLVYIQNNENKYSKYALRKNDFLLVMVGASIGKYATVTNEILPAFQNQNMWNFRALSNVSQYYLNHAMRYIVNDNINSASGSAREFFQKSYFYKIRILIPEKDIMYKFHKEIDSFYCKIEHNRKEIQSLQSMRDMLLSKILNEKKEV